MDEIDSEEAKRMIETENPILLDVRTLQEHEDQNIPNSILIPLSNKFSEEVKKLDKEKKIIVYCRTGHRSRYAALIMDQLGFKNVYNLEGGILRFNKDNN